MDSVRGKLTAEQVSNTFREGSRLPRKLNYVINFDERTWVGQGWDNDQINLADYQPDGWTAKEADPYQYLPSELRGILSK